MTFPVDKYNLIMIGYRIQHYISQLALTIISIYQFNFVWTKYIKKEKIEFASSIDASFADKSAKDHTGSE